ncbi:MAG: polymer-forming cytoskeletal protein [Ignavibacteriales bacterium]|nr:polymer-forming cytoskeletal protein [Ignavibacteriales bacterium]
MAKNDPVKELNIIGPGTVIEGKIRSQGSVRVDGKVIGEVAASESLAVGSTGEIEGNCSAKNVTVGGKIKGSINAAEKIVFEGRSTVRGDIRATRLVIDEGCMFDGRVTMADRGSSYEQRH